MAPSHPHPHPHTHTHILCPASPQPSFWRLPHCFLCAYSSWESAHMTSAAHPQQSVGSAQQLPPQQGCRRSASSAAGVVTWTLLLHVQCMPETACTCLRRSASSAARGGLPTALACVMCAAARSAPTRLVGLAGRAQGLV